MEYTIRPAGYHDIDVITEFNTAMAKETENIDLDTGILKQGVREVIEDPCKGWYYLAEMDGKIIGQTLVTLEWSDWRNGYWWWIQSVYVLPEWRRRKVFHTLYHHVENEARKQGNVIGLRLYVDEDNEAAQLTYEEVGMNESNYRFFEYAFSKINE